MSKNIRIAPDYYDRFRCKGGACRNSCCMGWGISVDMKEYFRLIGLDCSPRLHARLECAFHQPDTPSPERYALISPDWRGDCPMHDEDGLCMLHRECGEDVLPAVCRMYPRSVREENGVIKCVCSASCEAVTELLMDEEAPLSFRADQTRDEPSLRVESDRRLLELTRACLTLLQGRTRPLPARIGSIGALLAAFEESGACDSAAALSAAQPAAWPVERALPAAVRLLRRLAQNSPSLERFGAAMLERYDPDDSQLFALYRRDAAAFERAFPDWPRWFENLLANHIFYEDFPFTDKRLTPSGEYTGLVGVYAAMRVMSVGCTAERAERDALIDALSGLFRCIEHAAFYLNADYLLECEEQGDRGLLGGVLAL